MHLSFSLQFYHPFKHAFDLDRILIRMREFNYDDDELTIHELYKQEKKYDFYINIQREIILFIYYLLSDCFENLANNLSIGATATKDPALP